MSRGRGAGRGGMTGWGAFGSFIPPPIDGSQPQGYPGPALPVAPGHFGGEGPFPMSQINLPSTGDHIQGELPSVLCLLVLSRTNAFLHILSLLKRAHAQCNASFCNLCCQLACTSKNF